MARDGKAIPIYNRVLAYTGLPGSGFFQFKLRILDLLSVFFLNVWFFSGFSLICLFFKYQKQRLNICKAQKFVRGDQYVDIKLSSRYLLLLVIFFALVFSSTVDQCYFLLKLF